MLGSRRELLGCALLAAAMAPAALGGARPTPALPEPVHLETGAPPPDELLLDGFLLPVPKGYKATGLKDQPGQQDPIKLSKAEALKLGFPYRKPTEEDGMGWVRPDHQYFNTIAPRAREIPRSLKHLPVVRFNNIDQSREREIRFRQHGEYDQWFLHDFTAEFTSLLTIHRRTRHAYFFDYDWEDDEIYLVTTISNCFNCHPSGPRVIRTYATKKTDAAVLKAFNRRILSYGAVDYGDNIDPKRLGPPVDDARCVGCHDGNQRGKIYRIHGVPLAYYLKKLRNMPPGAPLSPAEADALIARLHQRWKAATAPQPRAGADCTAPEEGRLRRIARRLPSLALRP
jgi:hypothetical protein